DRERIGADGGAVGLGGARSAQRPGDLAVRGGGAAGDRAQQRPDLLLEGGRAEVQRQVELLALAGEIGQQLLLGDIQQRVRRGSCGPESFGAGEAGLILPPEPGDGSALGGDQVQTQRGGDPAMPGPGGVGGAGRGHRRDPSGAVDAEEGAAEGEGGASRRGVAWCCQRCSAAYERQGEAASRTRCSAVWSSASPRSRAAPSRAASPAGAASMARSPRSST